MLLRRLLLLLLPIWMWLLLQWQPLHAVNTPLHVRPLLHMWLLRRSLLLEL